MKRLTPLQSLKCQKSYLEKLHFDTYHDNWGDGGWWSSDELERIDGVLLGIHNRIWVIENADYMKTDEYKQAIVRKRAYFKSLSNREAS